MSAVIRALAVSLVLAVVASPALGGQQGYTSPDITLTPPPGWSLTPAMGVSQTWDDNITLKGPGDNPLSDVINVVNPRAELNFNSPRGQLAARYDGCVPALSIVDHARQLRAARNDQREAQAVQEHGLVHQRRRLSGADDPTAPVDRRAIRSLRDSNGGCARSASNPFSASGSPSSRTYTGSRCASTTTHPSPTYCWEARVSAPGSVCASGSRSR